MPFCHHRRLSATNRRNDKNNTKSQGRYQKCSKSALAESSTGLPKRCTQEIGENLSPKTRAVEPLRSLQNGQECKTSATCQVSTGSPRESLFKHLSTTSLPPGILNSQSPTSAGQKQRGPSCRHHHPAGPAPGRPLRSRRTRHNPLSASTAQRR